MEDKHDIPIEVNEWDDIEGIPQQVLRGIYGYGFDKPSPIQKRAILPILHGKDIIAQAQSGTGKTGCFTVSLLSTLNPDALPNDTHALILAPTRELAQQIFNVLQSLGAHVSGLRLKLLYGGTSIESDVKSLRESAPHIIVGCPGRVHDMMRRKAIDTSKINILVLDEADEMLSVGFKDQVYNIFQFLRRDVQVALFSATLPHEVLNLTTKFMRDPVQVLVKAEQLTLEGISQYYIGLNDDGQKYATLKDLYQSLSVSQCIIYCNSVRRVNELYEAMREDGYPVCCIHSGMDKQERGKGYAEFRQGKFRVLISSNVTARGIDIQQVSTVVNFDMPRDVHIYLHRIGRSGRWGRKGIGINFVTRRDYHKLKEIERYYSTTIAELPQSFVDGN